MASLSYEQRVPSTVFQVCTRVGVCVCVSVLCELLLNGATQVSHRSNDFQVRGLRSDHTHAQHPAVLTFSEPT